MLVFACLSSCIAQTTTEHYTSIVPQEIRIYHDALEHALLNGNVDTARVIYDDMIENIDSSGNAHVQAWIWYHYGDVLSYSQKYELSNEAYEKAIAITNTTDAPDIIILIRAYNNLYYNNDEMGDSEVAFDHILRSYEYLANAPPEENKANIIFNLARALKKEGELGLAGRYMEQVIQLDKEKHDSLAIGYDHQFLGEIYRLQKNLLRAKNEYKKAISITPRHHFDRHSMYHIGIADALGDEGLHELALSHVDTAVSYARSSNSNNILAVSLTEKADICIAQKDLQCAQLALSEAAAIAEVLDMKEQQARINLRMAILSSGSEKKQKLLDIVTVTQNQHWEDLEMSAYKHLLEDQALLSTLEKTNILTQYNTALKDRITLDAGQEAKRLEARMILIDREQEINDLQRDALIAEKKAQYNLTIRYVLLAIIILSIASTILIYQTLKQKRQLAEATFKNQISTKVKEVEALKSRLTAAMNQQKEVISIPSFADLLEIIDSPLTKKEYDVLVDVSAGLTNREIAEKQYISTNTVKFHLKNIYSKLDVNNRKEAVNLVLQES